jgi:hypothetical protein
MTTQNGYTKATMNSTEVYNYLKKLARKTKNDGIDCVAEATISVYGDDVDIDTREVERIVTGTGFMTERDYKEMQCEVITTLSEVSFAEAHID